MSEAIGIEAKVCHDIAERQRLGIAKYGTTVADNPLTVRQWVQHAYEECLDQAVYMRKLMDELNAKKILADNPPADAHRAVTRSEANRWLNAVAFAKTVLDAQWEDFAESVNGSPDSPLGLAVWRPMELLIDCVAKLLGDDAGTIDWFFWDNDGGEKGLEHSLPCGEMRAVKTVDDLLDVLGVRA